MKRLVLVLAFGAGIGVGAALTGWVADGELDRARVDEQRLAAREYERLRAILVEMESSRRPSEAMAGPPAGPRRSARREETRAAGKPGAPADGSEVDPPGRSSGDRGSSRPAEIVKPPSVEEIRSGKMIDLLVEARLREPGTRSAALLAMLERERADLRQELAQLGPALERQLARIGTRFELKAEERDDLLRQVRESMLELLSPHVTPDVARRAIEISPVLRR